MSGERGASTAGRGTATDGSRTAGPRRRDHEGRAADPGVPARRLRRRRGPCRLPRPGVARPGRPGGALLERRRLAASPSRAPGLVRHRAAAELDGANAALRTFSVDLAMAAALHGSELVHSHTWYANLAGHLAKLLLGVPHVMTAHSLEPLRPWKAEQLGGGYALSGWAERTAIEAADAVIAVSHGMRADILTCYPALDPDRVRVVHNGIDTELYRPDPDTDVLRALDVDPDRPSVVFVGRITRQKGVTHLLRAMRELPPEVQLVLCAGAPDPPGLVGDPGRVFASMGNYIFTTKILLDALHQDAEDPGSAHDLGGSILPMLTERGMAQVYDFDDNHVPGETARDHGYWRDVGTLDSYYEAHMDLISAHPIFNLHNQRWPIFTYPGQLPPAKFVSGGIAGESIVGPGRVIRGQVTRSVLSPGVIVEEGAVVQGSVLHDNVRVGRHAVVRGAVIDKNVDVPPGATVGVNPDRDRELYAVSPNGIITLGKGQRVP
ncbi:glycogen synthase [Streptomyces sp. H27-D2]|uniref:glycogen synthase n=1 Tax=Streptomyces sp. H27-D2 TaxID=3046304 RepID=UPI002DBF9570|nr:glycogen synthase [Streptomyces sp. H27-D2]MEC4017890.1 glycogen synthase [Streptomyces sp. H27-D2]